MTEQAESLDKEVRAFLVEAALANRDAEWITRKVFARWGTAGMDTLLEFGDECEDVMGRAERRRLARGRRKR